MAADVLVRNAWYVAGLSHEFPPQQLQGQVIAEKPLVMWRTATGAVVAFDERCCHKRMPLSAGRLIESDLLECAYHGLCYDAAGRCVRVPSHPDGRIPPQARLRPFPVIEQDGLVWVWTGDPAQSRGRPAAAPAGDRRPGMGNGRYRADGGARQLAVADREPARHHAFLPAARRQYRRCREQPHPGRARRRDPRRQPLCRDHPRGPRLPAAALSRRLPGIRHRRP